MNPITKIRNLTQNIRQHGFVETFKLYCYRIHERFRDWRLGICTSRFVERESTGHEADCSDYEAINYRCLDIVMDFLNPEPNKEVFLDYGCGKGRAVVAAATLPFRKVIGVELSKELSDIARENIHRATEYMRCKNIEIITANAVDWEVPPDVSMVFLFNPFTGSILSEVQEQLRKSLIETPRQMKIVYMHPIKQPDYFSKCDWLTKHCELPTANWDEVKLLVYENLMSDVYKDPAVSVSQ